MFDSLTIYDSLTTQILYNKQYNNQNTTKQQQYSNTIIQCNIICALYQQYDNCIENKLNVHKNEQCNIQYDNKYIVNLNNNKLTVSYRQHKIITTIQYNHITQQQHNNNTNNNNSSNTVKHLQTYIHVIQYISDRFCQFYSINLKHKQIKQTFNALLPTIYTHIQHILLTLLLTQYNNNRTNSDNCIDWLYVVYNNIQCDNILTQLQTINLIPTPNKRITKQHNNNKLVVNTSIVPHDSQLSTPDGALHITTPTHKQQYVWHNNYTTNKSNKSLFSCFQLNKNDKIQPIIPTTPRQSHTIVYNNIITNKLNNNTIQCINNIINQCTNLCITNNTNLYITTIQYNRYTIYIQCYNNIILVYQCNIQCEFDTTALDMIQQFYTLLHTLNT